jgi:ubiquinone/menaquinone biosynthesis C-methylase UbiE
MGAPSKPASPPESGQAQPHDVDIDAGADAMGRKDALPGVLRSVEDDSWNPPLSTIEPDFSIEDEAYAASVTTSYVSSLASDIRKGIEENGRLYAAYGIHKPWVPIDDRELNRNDLQHYKFLLLLDEQLFLSPIPEKPQKILDLGTGSGIWAIDVADQYESAEVIGVDTAPTQPDVLPPNVIFEIDDVENDWLWPESSFDLIYGRELIMAIRDWPRLIRQAYRHLKPGGYIELSGSYPSFQSDDDTLPADSAYVETGQIYFDMSERIGSSGHEVRNWKQYLEEAGFVDVQQRIFRIPTNPWPKDPTLKKIGAFELLHYRDNIANVFARGYSQILGGDPAYFELLMARARKEVANRDMHSWVPYFVVYGRRPR